MNLGGGMSICVGYIHMLSIGKYYDDGRGCFWSSEQHSLEGNSCRVVNINSAHIQ